VSKKIVKILGIPFFNDKTPDCFCILNQYGGLLTVPSGPGLANIPNDRIYYQALLNSDIVIADSGYMTLIWNKISSSKINRISGLEFINYFIEASRQHEFKSVFLVNPNSIEEEANLKLFNSLGYGLSNEDSYLAPFYGKGEIADHELLKILNDKKPHWVFLNIGGGVQEILGSYLKDNLSYKPAIICTGAAIAFKTGNQVNIPVWADKLYLGWLFRIFSNPKSYIKRYWDAVPLFNLLLKYKDKPVVFEN
jgi:N-acetylglucosaminyldiphosphoundecaprenol N-acetyl-beta-D-mannosaminyltransferase